jgi:hypothetical protein
VTSSANTPGETPEGFYDAAPLEPHLLYQGEILINVPFLDIPKPPNWQLIRTKSGRRVDEALNHGSLGGLVRVLDSNVSHEEWGADGRGDFVMARLQKGPALVLNTTCDLQNKDFVQIAPVFPVGGDAAHLERLRNGEIISAIWIQARPPDIPEESYADLELIQAVHKSFVRRIRPDQHFRLNPERVRSLQRATTFYFGRPNSFDSRADAVPRTGTYLCVRCFYLEGRASAKSLYEGGEFGFCEACGGTTWVIQGR